MIAYMAAKIRKCDLIVYVYKVIMSIMIHTDDDVLDVYVRKH